MSTFKTVSLLVLAILLVVCGTAGASTMLFHDDFQSDTAGTAPGSVAGNLNPGAPATGWMYVVEPTSSAEVQVWNNLNPGDPTNDAGANNYLMMTRLSTDQSSSFAWMGGWDASSTNNKIVQLSYSVYVKAGSATDVITITGFTDDAFNGRSFNTYFYRNGTVKYFNGTDMVTTSLTGIVDAWQNLVITADMAAKTYTINLDGTTVNANWSGGAATSVGTLFMGSGAETGNRAFFDNLSLQIVPEPSTLALMTTALFGLLCYAWRRRR